MCVRMCVRMFVCVCVCFFFFLFLIDLGLSVRCPRYRLFALRVLLLCVYVCVYICVYIYMCAYLYVLCIFICVCFYMCVICMCFAVLFYVPSAFSQGLCRCRGRRSFPSAVVSGRCAGSRRRKSATSWRSTGPLSGASSPPHPPPSVLNANVSHLIY